MITHLNLDNILSLTEAEKAERILKLQELVAIQEDCIGLLKQKMALAATIRAKASV